MGDANDPKAHVLTRQTADIKRSAKAVEQSAGKLTDSAGELTDSADRRTVLAGDRTLLAAERTYAAWVRTALAALAAGVGARALLDKVVPAWMGRVTGTVLVLFAAFCFFAAVWRQMREAVPPPRPDLKPVPRVLLVAINGFLLLVTLAVLVGLWAT